MNYEGIVRLSFFLGVFVVIALWELLAPRRVLTVSKKSRWSVNLSMVVLNMTLIRFLSPILPVGLALLAQDREWGLFNLIKLPYWSEVIISIIALDFIIYLQHVLFHHSPVLWRLHRMHHTDLDLDVTSGNRFHPLEIIISLGIKLAAVVLIGAPSLAVLIFEILLNAASQFNHGNILVPESIDKWLRLIIVTPDMHRIHHSIYPHETNSNYGFNLPWWDRLYRTYRPDPEDGHINMIIGLKKYREMKQLTFWNLLMNPFT